jgi:hypothetical protein
MGVSGWGRARDVILKGIGVKGGRVKNLAGRMPPPVFCERVRKMLRGKELWEHSFWKSAEEIENKVFNFSRFLEKSEKSDRGNGFLLSDGRVALRNGDFNAEGTESTEFTEKIEESERGKM